MQTVHATCIGLAGVGVLLCGPSGAGKSDLALRLIDAGAELVADDRVVLTPEGGRLLASPPPPLAGLLEVRGLGLVRLPFRPRIAVALAAELRDRDAIERLPEPAHRRFGGIELPLVCLAAFEASAPAKLRLAVRLAAGVLPAVA